MPLISTSLLQVWISKSIAVDKLSHVNIEKLLSKGVVGRLVSSVGSCFQHRKSGESSHAEKYWQILEFGETSTVRCVVIEEPIVATKSRRLVLGDVLQDACEGFVGRE